jgi:hypothetical protein
MASSSDWPSALSICRCNVGAQRGLAAETVGLFQHRHQRILHRILGQRVITKLQLCKSHKLRPQRLELAVKCEGGGHMELTLSDRELKYNKIAI